ncbi:DNA-directed RNA polymerase [Sphingopyxis flava]|uniref:DNA-directed RNA polymerase n=1 Tax=Sphingopyxis flava TaxID=1507287 RepID=A0A1T5BP89_9SPHN|nr:DNA-directed RNA polymerase [Sphingopyxis flava]SKB49102.1 DNA-directed RNA polymerase [Sphingopyxis flava]
MSDARELIRRQLVLEDEAHTLGAARYRQTRPMPWKDETGLADEEANLPPGQQLIKFATEPTAALIAERVEAAREGAAGRRLSAVKWLELASPEEVAYIAARVAVNSAARVDSFQTTAALAGDAIINHVEMLLFQEKNPAGYVGLIRANYRRTRGSAKRKEALRKLLANEEARIAIPKAEKIQLGAFALEALVDATGLFSLDRVPDHRGDRVYRIQPTEAVEAWLEKQHARCELLEPLHMPMIVRPKRWRSLTVGGYLTSPGHNPTAFIKAPRNGGPGGDAAATRDYLRQLANQDLSEVYKAVNHIQETAWAINKPILAIVREVWDSGGSLAGLPPRLDKPLPARPHDIDTNEEALAIWKRDAARVYEENAANRSQRFGVQQRLWMAERFANEDAIWFPHSLDFRGRVYPTPAVGFSPQSDDLGKALLKFAVGKPVGPTGGYWLAIHLANLFGVDKVSFGERVEWVGEHAAQIIDSALNPLDGERFWTTADSPWMALAACMEYVGFLDQGEDFISHLPIPLDGSNSGLQHFSALLRDPEGAAAVNLVPSGEPQDVYSVVAERAQAVVDADDDPDAAPWKNGKVTRKVSKRPTMTYVYSATRFGMQDMVWQTLQEIDAANAARGEQPHLEGADNYEAARYLSHVLYGAIGNVVSAAQGAMDWLREVAKVASDAGQAIQWTAPDGLLVRQSYRNVYGKRIKVHWQGRRLQVTLAVLGSALDTRGQTNGIAPNFVHSLDAAHLRAVARAAKRAGIDSLAVIHDSFGTHVADTDKLVRLLRDTFVAQYEDDILMDFYNEVVAQLPPAWAREVPPPPQKGDLDLNEVRHSSYLFA